MYGGRINGAKSRLFFCQNFHGLWLGKAEREDKASVGWWGACHTARRLPCRFTQSNVRLMLTHGLWAPWLEGDPEIAFADNGDISTDLTVSNMPRSLTAWNLCQYLRLQSRGTPLISAFLLAIILMHFFLSLHRCAVLPYSFHSPLLLLRSTGHSSVFMCPIIRFAYMWIKER